MNIDVEYIDQTGVVHNQTHRMTRLAFAKHLAIAGQRYAPKPQKLIRTLAMFLHYSSYMQRQEFRNDRFSEPPIKLSDPTEKGQFSNLAGKAIADFLSKRIDHSLYTVNYEAAMRIHNPPIPLFVNGKQVRRPDLLAFTNNSTFALEAKGFSSNGSGNMAKHKAQSRTGGIPVNFTVASVAYNLYDQVKCKYHDPFNDDIPYQEELLIGLTKDYYSDLSEFLNEEFFDYNIYEYQGEKFYEIHLTYRLVRKLFPNEMRFRPFWHHEFFEIYNPTLLLPYHINDYAKNGISRDIKPLNFQSESDLPNNYLYVDNDRIGLRIRQ